MRPVPSFLSSLQGRPFSEGKTIFELIARSLITVWVYIHEYDSLWIVPPSHTYRVDWKIHFTHAHCVGDTTQHLHVTSPCVRVYNIFTI